MGFVANGARVYIASRKDTSSFAKQLTGSFHPYHQPHFAAPVTASSYSRFYMQIKARASAYHYGLTYRRTTGWPHSQKPSARLSPLAYTALLTTLVSRDGEKTYRAMGLLAGVPVLSPIYIFLVSRHQLGTALAQISTR
jgi:peptidoglycan/LPS O-acetylase OafA/YrhL